MTQEQERQIKVIESLNPKLSDAKTPREEEFVFAVLVMKRNYSNFKSQKYQNGGKKRFVNSLKWFFQIYKDEISALTDYFFPSDNPIEVHSLVTGETTICYTIEECMELAHCCRKSVLDILAGRKDKCKGFTFKYKVNTI